jgi:glycosyltransferase involved in cell wall biosynthesis
MYNEASTISELLKRVVEAPLSVEKEIIVVDDGSTDNSAELVSEYMKSSNAGIRLVRKDNGGKGSAVRAGFAAATGDILIVQDADLEYDPNDIQKCIEPIVGGKAEVVYGSRQLHKENKKHSNLAFYLGGIVVTLTTNVLYFSRLTDEATCYKTFSSRVLKSFTIDSDGFEWEPEITAKILKSGVKIHEVPVRYYPRRVFEGKKIKYTDGLLALWTLLKYRFK